MEFKWGVLGWGNFLTKQDAIDFCQKYFIPNYRIFPLVDNQLDTSVSYIIGKQNRFSKKDDAPGTGLIITKQGTVNPFNDNEERP